MMDSMLDLPKDLKMGIRWHIPVKHNYMRLSKHEA